MPREAFDPETLGIRLVAVDDVSRQAAADKRDAIEHFYGRVLGLSTVTRTDEAIDADAEDRLRFVCEQVELRFILCEEPSEPTGRILLQVRSLDGLARRFDEYHVPYEWIHGFGYTDQKILVYDPAHHLVELLQTWSF